jgi:alpha-L-fucosidase
MRINRRDFLKRSAPCALAAGVAGPAGGFAQAALSSSEGRRGSQRLSREQLVEWEAMGYGMFIHFGMSTYVGNELPDGKAPASKYGPDALDVDQWISVARDAGMKYAVLTAKHVAGHCLWPSRHTDYSVANSTDKTNVVEKFVEACRKRKVKAGFYYCSWDNHNRFGSKTPSDGGDWNGMNSFPASQVENPPPYTTSLYQSFQTAQITELLKDYGPIGEMWIDIPGVLGRGYRRFLYEYIAGLQPDIVIMMNSGISDGVNYNAAYAWPSDLIAIERRLPPESGHEKWRTIEGKEYYMPGEVCDPIGKWWFHATGDTPRSDQELLSQLRACRERGANLLLNVPPDRRGVIPDYHVEALMRLRKNAGI